MQPKYEFMTNIFKIRREERWMALVALLFFVFLNALMIYAHYQSFTKGGPRMGYFSLFTNKLHFSGYDPAAYLTLSKWNVYYNPYRHPLISLFLYPLACLNNLIIDHYSYNAAMFFMAGVMVVCSVYSVIFMYRVFRDVIEVSKAESRILVVLMFSFCSIMTASMSPDHFMISLFFLSMTLYIAGLCLKESRSMKWYQTAGLYILTSGVTLTNGAKSLLSGWFTNGWRFFRIKHLLGACVVPTVFLLGMAYWQEQAFVIPNQERGKRIEMERMKNDSAFAQRVRLEQAHDKEVRGKSGSDIKIFKWGDTSTPRMKSAVENLFGESILLHQDYLLGDIYTGRPVFVSYRSVWHYMLIGVVVLLFLGGLFCGIRQKFLLMTLSWVAVDFVIHFVFGFGLNEVYIMGCHWIFLIPVAMAYLLKGVRERTRTVLGGVMALLATFLLFYNGSLIVGYMLK